MSSALRAISPVVSSVGASAIAPSVETRPEVGFQPVTPQACAGIRSEPPVSDPSAATTAPLATAAAVARDRKSTRLNSSYLGISYAVFCLKKKKKSEKLRQQLT